jgi:hypothetical protein
LHEGRVGLQPHRLLGKLMVNSERGATRDPTRGSVNALQNDALPGNGQGLWAVLQTKQFYPGRHPRR